ncbi:MAG: hypothetical protein K2K79_03965 [Paramuribaculum sp.]|nr:hypothetical protein [Paramuribaculum sp.]
MEYSKEFTSLIDSTSENYIGHGNPNAKILFLGQEGASDPDAPTEVDGRNDYKRSIEGNRKDWTLNIQNNTGYDDLAECSTPDTLFNYNPLFPYMGQKFQVRSENNHRLKGAEGTARTWYNYQKLINRIFENISSDRAPLTKNDKLDFHRLSFHTDMSSVASKKHNERKESGRQSVVQRVSFLSSNYFQKFPVVIAAVGHFPRESYKIDSENKSYFEKVFDVRIQNTINIGRLWININKCETGAKRLLIHCPQFSASISDDFISQVANIVTDFAKEQKINLLPDE